MVESEALDILCMRQQRFAHLVLYLTEYFDINHQELPGWEMGVAERVASQMVQNTMCGASPQMERAKRERRAKRAFLP